MGKARPESRDAMLVCLAGLAVCWYHGCKGGVMFQLTEEQRQEIQMADPARAVDPQTGETYVLIREEVYERIKSMLDDFDPREGYPLVDRIMAEDDALDQA